ncbi:MAG: Arc family DNA binding domain-containing protein, partial [Atopobiaceae bacterium]|nr:Arc family DNA binding domain-containing protein [Atopobiaceae bacterium]
MSRKQYPLRIDSDIWDAIQKWAADDMRSANGQVE